MKWITAHAWDIIKTVIGVAVAALLAWAALQVRLSGIDSRDALQDQAIASVKGSVSRIEKEAMAQNNELKQQLKEIQTQLHDIGKAVAVLADRAGYRGGKNNED